MSNWGLKSSNKKIDNQQITKTNLKTSQRDYSTSLSAPKQSETRNATNMTTSGNHQTWHVLKDRLQASTIHQAHSHMPREMEQTLKNNTLETPIAWEQILDREFQSLDIDADGFVSIADMQSVLKNFSHIYNSNDIMLRIFEELDRNHDQRISKQEFQLYKNILLDREQHFHRSTFEDKFDSIFLLFDRNRDNYISPHEIRETMHNLGEHINDDLIEEMMRTADTNHDGRISREEFKRLLRQLHSEQ